MNTKRELNFINITFHYVNKQNRIRKKQKTCTLTMFKIPLLRDKDGYKNLEDPYQVKIRHFVPTFTFHVSLLVYFPN